MVNKPLANNNTNIKIEKQFPQNTGQRSSQPYKG